MATSDNKTADTDEKIFIGKGEQTAWLSLALANRHGLVTGATGTGKTVSLQVMAEGFARQLVRDGQRVYSAGTAPKEIHPMAIQVMKEVGIDISGQHSKGVESIPLNQIHRIVTLCGEAAENCPALSEKVEHIHWSLSDPAHVQGPRDEILRSFRGVRDQIYEQVEKLFAAPSRDTSDSPVAQQPRILN